MNRMLDGWRSGVWHGVEVHRDDGHTVGELLDVFSSRVKAVEVV